MFRSIQSNLIKPKIPNRVRGQRDLLTILQAWWWLLTDDERAEWTVFAKQLADARPLTQSNFQMYALPVSKVPIHACREPNGDAESNTAFLERNPRQGWSIWYAVYITNLLVTKSATSWHLRSKLWTG